MRKSFADRVIEELKVVPSGFDSPYAVIYRRGPTHISPRFYDNLRRLEERGLVLKPRGLRNMVLCRDLRVADAVARLARRYGFKEVKVWMIQPV